MKQFTKNKLERYKQSALDLIMVALCFYALGWLIIYGVNWFNNMINWLFYV